MNNTVPRGVVLCSGSASSFRFLCENDPNYGKTYKIVGVFSDVSRCSGIAYAQDRRVPTATFDFRAWCGVHKVSRSDFRAREAYFRKLIYIIAGAWEADFIILSGFMLRITEPLLSRFEGRILNVHPALLSIQDDGGKRKYTGLGVVKRAMEVCDPTGSTVHIATDEPDMGPIVIESPPLPYKSGDDPNEHQERMKVLCDGPAFQAALDTLISSGWPSVSWHPE
jgi:phosphoribosylglycinamide formyltransferase-1